MLCFLFAAQKDIFFFKNIKFYGIILLLKNRFAFQLRQ